MTEALAVNIDSEASNERKVTLAGLATEAKECRTTEAFRTNQITINPLEDPSDSQSRIVFSAAKI